MNRRPLTLRSIAVEMNQEFEFVDYTVSMLEMRIIALEEIIATPWPRRMFLRYRLARALRASVAGYDVEHFGRDFAGRRLEAMGAELIARSLVLRTPGSPQ